MGTVYLTHDHTLFIGCGSTLNIVCGDSTSIVTCGDVREELSVEEDKIKEEKLSVEEEKIKIEKLSVEEDKIKEKKLFVSPHIIGIDVSCTKCVVVSSNKVLEVWSRDSLQRTAVTLSPKRATAVKLTHKGSEIVLSDKSGDVYLYNIDLTVKKYLLGHVSMILDIALSPSNHLLVTSDRDEKVRASHFPNSYNIQQYCLGHTECVINVTFISDTLLASISGDRTLKLWDVESGTCLQTLPNKHYTHLQYNGEHLFTVHNTQREDKVTSCISVLELSQNKLKEVSEASFDIRIVSLSVTQSKCLLLTCAPKVIIVPVKLAHVLVGDQQCVGGLTLSGLVDNQNFKIKGKRDERTNVYFDRKKRRLDEENAKATAKVVATSIN